MSTSVQACCQGLTRGALPHQRRVLLVPAGLTESPESALDDTPHESIDTAASTASRRPGAFGENDRWSLEVRGGCTEDLGTVLASADPDVAAVAEQTANVAQDVIVIHAETDTVGRRSPANRATITLLTTQFLVGTNRQPVEPAAECPPRPFGTTDPAHPRAILRHECVLGVVLMSARTMRHTTPSPSELLRRWPLLPRSRHAASVSKTRRGVISGPMFVGFKMLNITAALRKPGRPSPRGAAAGP